MNELSFLAAKHCRGLINTFSGQMAQCCDSNVLSIRDRAQLKPGSYIHGVSVVDTLLKGPLSKCSPPIYSAE